LSWYYLYSQEELEADDSESLGFAVKLPRLVAIIIDKRDLFATLRKKVTVSNANLLPEAKEQVQMLPTSATQA